MTHSNSTRPTPLIIDHLAVNRLLARLSSFADKHDAGPIFCACRDCFEVTVGIKGAICTSCETAQCDPDQECQSHGAYGGPL